MTNRPRAVTAEESTDLESLVDSCGMEGVALALASIAREKAEHVRTNWQDQGLAKQWQRLASMLDMVETRACQDNL